MLAYLSYLILWDSCCFFLRENNERQHRNEMCVWLCVGRGRVRDRQGCSSAWTAARATQPSDPVTNSWAQSTWPISKRTGPRNTHTLSHTHTILLFWYWKTLVLGCSCNETNSLLIRGSVKWTLTCLPGKKKINLALSTNVKQNSSNTQTKARARERRDEHKVVLHHLNSF